MDELITFEAHDSYVLALLFTPDSRTLVSAGMDNVVKLWTAPNCVWTGMLKGHDNSVDSLSLTPDGETLAFSPDEHTVALGLDGKVEFCSVADWALQKELPLSSKVAYGLAFSPDGEWFATGPADGRIRVWKLGARSGLPGVVEEPGGR